MRKSECVLVTDREMTADEIMVEQVKLLEQKARADTIVAMLRTGKVYVLEDEDPLNMRVAVGENVFTCLRDEFPTIELMAQVALAVDAGQGENTFELWRYHNQHTNGDYLREYARDAHARMMVGDIAYGNCRLTRAKIEDDYRDGKKPKLDEYVKKGLRP